MKVKEILAKLQLEHPDAEVTPCQDEHGKSMVLVTPPGTNDGAIDAYPEAVQVLGKHVRRIERIRLEIATFYGLPVSFRIKTAPSQRDNVEFVVKSFTGEIMAQADLGIEYVVVNHPSLGWQKEPIPHQLATPVRFSANDPEMTGYYFWPNKYILTRERLGEVIRKFCDAPKLSQEQAAIVVNLC